MKQVSVQALKANLSSLVTDAESGETIVVTRHNTPVARLGPARHPNVHYGSRVGQGRITPAIKGGTGGRALEILKEDRDGR